MGTEMTQNRVVSKGGTQHPRGLQREGVVPVHGLHWRVGQGAGTKEQGPQATRTPGSLSRARGRRGPAEVGRGSVPSPPLSGSDFRPE